MIFRDLEQKIIKVINESGISIDAAYFIMKSIMAEIEQRYFEFCQQEDAAAAQREIESKENKENISKIEEIKSTNVEEEGAN